LRRRPVGGRVGRGRPPGRRALRRRPVAAA
jgi:hypothetical protein